MPRFGTAYRRKGCSAATPKPAHSAAHFVRGSGAGTRGSLAGRSHGPVTQDGSPVMGLVSRGSAMRDAFSCRRIPQVMLGRFGARLSRGTNAAHEDPRPPLGACRHEFLPLRTARVALCRRAVQHGVCRFLYLPDPALWPVAGARRGRDRHPGGGALDPRLVPVDPYRRLDGPIRHAPGHLVLRVDGDGSGAAVSAGAGVLGACCCCSWSTAPPFPSPGPARRP